MEVFVRMNELVAASVAFLALSLRVLVFYRFKIGAIFLNAFLAFQQLYDGFIDFSYSIFLLNDVLTCAFDHLVKLFHN